jgi:hypothetical protein
MAVHSPLNAFSFDISLIEIGQEIKLLEHFKKSLDHPVYKNESPFVSLAKTQKRLDRFA